jgi:hypothetical protein
VRSVGVVVSEVWKREREMTMTVLREALTAAIAETALALFAARQDRKRLFCVLTAYRVKHGVCEGHSRSDEDGSPCYYVRALPFDQWCDVCQGAQPLWLAYRKASDRCGAEMRSLMSRCNRAAIDAARKP